MNWPLIWQEKLDQSRERRLSLAQSMSWAKELFSSLTQSRPDNFSSYAADHHGIASCKTKCQWWTNDCSLGSTQSGWNWFCWILLSQNLTQTLSQRDVWCTLLLRCMLFLFWVLRTVRCRMIFHTELCIKATSSAGFCGLCEDNILQGLSAGIKCQQQEYCCP